MRLLALLLLTTTATAAEFDVWIGTHQTRYGETEGIYHLTFDDQTGKLSPARLAAERTGAGWLTRHPTLPVLYSTGGGVTAWRIERDGDHPTLTKLNEQETGGGGAAHLAVDHTGKVLLSAQYGSGTATSYKLADDGSIAARVSVLHHDDPSGVVANRQKSCHPHWVGMSPDNRFLFVPDLGADRIYVHKLNAETGELAAHNSVRTPAGGGARHFKFHPSGKFGYVVNELAMTLSVFDWNANAGELTLRQTVPTLSDEQQSGEAFNSGSEVRVHPSGKFVYSANRGHDTITVFAVDQENGKLTQIEQEPIRGSWPRNFNLDPSGRWLLAAGRDSNTLAVFAIDQATGELQYTLETASVPAPICVVLE